MNARSLLIVIGLIFLSIAAVLSLQILSTVNKNQVQAQFVANAHTDKADELAALLFKERIIAVAVLGKDNDKTKLNKQIKTNDKAFVNIFSSSAAYKNNDLATIAVADLEKAYKAQELARNLVLKVS